MENASKALIMAGEMLIAILVASALVTIFSVMSEYAKSYEDKLKADEIQAFNTQFTKYSDNATLQDLITLKNLAASYSDAEKPEVNIQLASGGTIELDAGNFGVDATNTSMEKYYIKNDTDITYDEEGRITRMVFTKRP